VLSARILILSEGVLKAMTRMQVKVAAVMLLTLGL